MLRNKGLTEKEVTILGALDTVGVTSVASLAAATNLRSESVRYGLQNLLDRQLLSPFSSIDPAALGFSSYIIYFTLSPAPSPAIESALRALVSHQNISWVGELSGAFQYGCTVCARGAGHAISLLEGVAQTMGVKWQRKSIAERTRLIFWPLKFFGRDTEASLAISYPTRPIQHDLDQLDHTILHLKSGDPMLSNTDIARMLGAPVSTIVHRVQQLLKRGILLGSWYAPNWSNLGMGHSEVSVLLREVSASLIEELVCFGRRTRSCHYVVGGMGSWDFQFNILSSHPSQLQSFTSELWEAYGDRIETVNVSAYTRLLKYSTYPFKDLGGAP